MKEAIQKAIEGGYEPSNMELEHWDKMMPNLHRKDQWRICSYALLDPLFWQCLGKAMGWKNLENEEFEIGCTIEARPFPIKPRETVGAELNDEARAIEFRQRTHEFMHSHSKGWQYQMHRFIDHIAEGKDVDEFFKDLIH